MNENNVSGGIRSSLDTKRLVYLAVLSALVVILQLVSNISAGFLSIPITLTLVPVVMGCALSGKWSGAWLGGVFAVTVLLSGAAEPFLTINPLGCIVTVMLKGVAAGLVAGVLYSLLEKKNRYLAVIVAGASAPIVNTGVFLIGAFIFFKDFILSLAGGEALFTFVVTVLVGVNFLVELGVNILLAPVILRLINLKKKV